MSYPIDLDEYTDRQLNDEIVRRAKLKAEGRCDYCGRLGDMPTCRFTERHSRAKEVLENLRRDP